VVVLAVAERRRSLPTPALKTDEGSWRAGWSCWRRCGRSWRREADDVFFSLQCAKSGPIWVCHWPGRPVVARNGHGEVAPGADVGAGRGEVVRWGRASRAAAKAASFLQQRGGGDFTSLIWVRPGRGPGVHLLPRPVGNCLRRWRTVSYGQLFRGCPLVSTLHTLSTSQAA
jgi:hypothetical protein